MEHFVQSFQWATQHTHTLSGSGTKLWI